MNDKDDQITHSAIVSNPHKRPDYRHIFVIRQGQDVTGRLSHREARGDGLVVIAGVKDGKISHEHIYWDQASVLVQIGLLDPAGLGVNGAESASKVLDPKLPSRKM
jgi:hypothetical protein